MKGTTKLRTFQRLTLAVCIGLASAAVLAQHDTAADIDDGGRVFQNSCANCHGPDGTGGQAPFTITDADNRVVAQVNWRAPALNTVLLRYSRDEVTFVINYGRPFSPMPGWGASVNKGPLNEQQISNVVDYLESIQLSPEEAQRVAREIRAMLDGSWTDRDGGVAPLKPSDFMVVAPYNAQVAEIDRAVKARLGVHANVGTVDKFQGREAPVAVYSMTTSSPSPPLAG